ncbi:MAG: 50S ribosomal protein L6 [Actinobacteria bacterium]|nr:50S ribosomal protein L6 [Actinomycetota bacterium]
MSKIGRKPIKIPQGVEVEISDGNFVRVKGPKGVLERKFHPEVIIKKIEDELIVEAFSEENFHKALHGTVRQVLANMVEGVSNGFSKALEIVGVGYRAALKGQDLEISVGYSKPVIYKKPEGIDFELPNPNLIIVKGIDKEKVGQVAAEIRKIRKPEPYKGKGIRYQGEFIRRKAGKSGA